MSDQPQEKKIIVDEDWKTQVQAEKEAASQPPREEPGEAPAKDSGDGAGQDVPLPPASLEILIGSLATQAMVSLGIFPNPATNEIQRLPHQAKHLVDMLQVLQEKTEGNRTAEESTMLEDTVHQLRMAYVQISQAAGEG
jgi:Domain of unknown function (DUF1844)